MPWNVEQVPGIFAVNTAMTPQPNDEESQRNRPTGGSSDTYSGGMKSPALTESTSAHGKGLLDDLVTKALPELLTSDDDGNTVVNIATLQRMVIFQLQVDILDTLVPLSRRRYGGKNPLKDETLKKNLADYVRMVRDWELMVDYQKRAEGSTTGDPFRINGKWPLTGEAIRDRGLEPSDTAYARGSLEKSIGTFDQRTRINKTRSFKALAARFTMAISGGILLVGPMLLMVYHKDLTTSTVTTSVAVFVFAVIMSLYTEATPEVVVGAVAAYAAVLVVFVGTIFQST